MDESAEAKRNEWLDAKENDGYHLTNRATNREEDDGCEANLPEIHRIIELIEALDDRLAAFNYMYSPDPPTPAPCPGCRRGGHRILRTGRSGSVQCVCYKDVSPASLTTSSPASGSSLSSVTPRPQANLQFPLPDEAICQDHENHYKFAETLASVDVYVFFPRNQPAPARRLLW